MKNVCGTLSRWLFIFVSIFILAPSVFSANYTTYQAKIVKPDGYPLESNNVNFKFTILEPSGSCILYAETYSSVNMANTGGLISFSLGSGVKTYPVSSPTFVDIFNNAVASHSCDAGGPVSYSPNSDDTRKIVMQFHDGNGWQTLPAMTINAVPYAMYANDSQQLGGISATNYVRYSTIPTCTASQALQYTGASFNCVALPDSGVFSAADVATALSYTPANAVSVTSLNSEIGNVSSTVYAVSSTVNSLTANFSSLQNSVAVSLAAITSSQWVMSGTTLFYNSGNVVVSGGLRISMDVAACSINLAGALRYNSGAVEYCNGTTWTAFGVSGAGLQGLNGSTSGTQTFAIGTTGTAPTFATNNGVHTLNIPLASAGSVTGGLLSNADYSTFMNKITSSAASIAQVLGFTPANNATLANYAVRSNNLSDLTSSATARANLGVGYIGTLTTVDLSSADVSGTLAIARTPSYIGDVTKAAASNSLVLSSTGVVAGTYNKVTVDAKGRVISSSALTASDVNTALTYTAANSATVSSLNSSVIASFTSVANSLATISGTLSSNVSSQWTTSGAAIFYNSNVGVGTETPAAKLHIWRSGGTTIGGSSSDTANAGLLIEGGAAGAMAIDGNEIQQFGDTLFLRGENGINFAIGDGADGNSTTPMLLNSNGRLGVGTTNPLVQNHFHKVTTMGTVGALNINAAVLRISEAASTTLNFDGNTIVAEDDLFLGTKGSGVFHLISSDTVRVNIANTGNIGVGANFIPTARLHLVSGTTAANSAPLKFTSGTLMTAAQAGAMEYDGFGFYLTDGAGTRRVIATATQPGSLDNASIINSTGNMNLVPVGSVIVSATTQSTNSQTGALVVKGGLGVAGNIFASGTIITSSNIQGASITATNGMIAPYIAGSIVSSGSLTLDSTTHATKGKILLAPNGGYVGVGTVVPTEKFHVAGNGLYRSNDTILKVQESNHALGSAQIQVGQSDWYGFLNYDTATDVFTIDTALNGVTTGAGGIHIKHTSGNVGIGTSAPTEALQVSGAIRANAVLNSTNEIFEINAGITLTDSTNPALELRTTAAVSDAGAVRLTMGETATSFISFGKEVGGAAKSDYLYINNTGSVGIGTASPTQSLDVIGTIKFGADTVRAGHLKSVGSGLSPNPGSSAFGAIVEGANEGHLVLDLKNNQTNDAIAFRYSAAQNMVVDTVGLVMNGSGEVGIGTTVPSSKLEVVVNSSAITPGSGNAIKISNADPTLNNMAGLIFNASVTGSSGAGMYTAFEEQDASPAANLRFYTNSGSAFTERMRISKEGNVGIGTATPGAQLEVANGDIKIGTSGKGIGLTPNSPATPRDITWDGTGTLIRDTGYVDFLADSNGDASGGFRFYASGTTRASATPLVTIGLSGNVGIGTSTPTYPLHVSGSVRVYGNIYGGGNSVGTPSGETNGMWVYGPSYLNFGMFYTEGNPDKISISPNGGGTSVPVMVISGNGNIGIGTSSPSAALNVVGSGGADDDIHIDSYSDSQEGTVMLRRARGTVASATTLLAGDRLGFYTFRGYNGSAFVDLARMQSTTETDLNVSHTANLQFITTYNGASTERMRITASGAVGVGTAAPTAGYRMDVFGDLQVGNGGASQTIRFRTANTDSGFIRFNSTADSAGNSSLEIGTMDNNDEPIIFTQSGLERMRIHTNTYVGIGTATPTTHLAVNSSAGYTIISNKNSAAGGQEWRWYSSSTGAPLGSDSMCFGLGTCILSIYSSGNATLAGTLTQSSDVRLKREISSIPYALDAVTKLDGVTYFWKDSTKDATKQIGLIAQDVEKVFPEAVKTNAQGFKSVAYQNLVAPIINALREIREWMFATDERVSALEKDNAKIKAENQMLKEYLCEKDPSAKICK